MYSLFLASCEIMPYGTVSISTGDISLDGVSVLALMVFAWLIGRKR